MASVQPGRLSVFAPLLARHMTLSFAESLVGFPSLYQLLRASYISIHTETACRGELLHKQPVVYFTEDLLKR